MAEIHSIYKDHDAVKFLTGDFKALLLSYDGFLYKRVNSRFPKTSWKCSKGCQATVHTNNGIFVKLVPGSYHNHPVVDEIKKIETSMRIKQRVQTEFNLTSRQIYTEERTKLILRNEQNAHVQIDSFSKSKSKLYKYRQATFPKSPQHRRDILLIDEWRLTMDGSKNFLPVKDGTDDKILIFGTTHNLRVLCHAKYVVSDGTFKIQPEIFAQLYVFHAPYLGRTLPLLFCLLPNKTYNTYYRLIDLIRNVAMTNNLSFNPEKIIIDFELPMINAITHFSSEVITGCLFHYTQCLWRKVQDLGMAVAYKNNENVRLWVRRFSALPFLPLDDIDDGFIAVHESSPEPGENTVSRIQVEKFHDYMLNTWVDDRNAIYDRKIWNHFENEGPRTTNNAEGWNHKLNHQAKSRLPFFQFIHFLKGMQVDLDATKFDCITESPCRQSSKSKYINEKIAAAKQNYRDNDVDILSYLDSVSVALKLE